MPSARVALTAAPTQQAVTQGRRGAKQVSPAAVVATTAPPSMPVVAPPSAENGAVAATGTPPASPRKEGARRPLELAADERQAVEVRYLELAIPHEFDGIRSQIAEELHLSKTLVKRAVKDLRLRLHLPSWWEERQSVLPPEVIEAVRPHYVALLAAEALPPVGVHNQLAEELGLTALQVYRAIGRIRAELGLPKFNERPEVPAEPEAAQARVPGD